MENIPTTILTGSSPETTQPGISEERQRVARTTNPPVEDRVELTGEGTDLAAQVGQANNLIRRLEFSLDDDSGRVQVTSRDPEGEAVREIPSDEFLKVMTSLKKLHGQLLDEQA